MNSDPLSLTTRNVLAYLAVCGLAGERDAVEVRELGGGRSNIVLLVEWSDPPGRRWVVKQSLEESRVKDGCRSERGRIFREAESIRAIGPALGEGSAPEVLHIDYDNFLFVMTAAPSGSAAWKDHLLKGEVDLKVARQAARLMARMTQASRSDPQLREWFADRTVFDQLRIDPYYRTTAHRETDVRAAIVQLMANSWNIRTGLVHGDFSPENLLVSGYRVMLIDWEVVHWGDPAFDAGFVLNHLFLKAFHQPRFAARYFDAVREFWRTLSTELPGETTPGFEALTIRHLGGLMLARIDGKSPVDYIRDEDVKKQARSVAKQILREQPQRLEDVIRIVRGSVEK